MSMDHKAFVFDYVSFQNGLAKLLYSSLETVKPQDIVEFIVDNLGSLKDPYEGEPLDSSWESLLEFTDVHQYGDFALTMYYDPSKNIGLLEDWAPIEATLAREGLTALLLGSPFGPPKNVFDPGKMGSYFQNPKQVEEGRSRIKEIMLKPHMREVLLGVAEMFSPAAEEGKGLYITF